MTNLILKLTMLLNVSAWRLVCVKFKSQQYLTMNIFILMFILVPGVSIIFVYTKANIWSFWLGFVLCLLAEMSILVFYCFIKLQKAYRDSFTIKIQENYSLNFQRDYPFRTLVIGKDFYLNRFTEEARLTSKKLSLKSPEFEQQLQQIIINEVPYKQQIQEYIKQIKDKYHYLNKFNQSLIDFGTRMKSISNNSLLFSKTYSFAQHETYFKDDNFNVEFREEERRAFNQLKIKLKSPKTHEEGYMLGTGEAVANEQIVLPTWQSVLASLERIGVEFQQIQEMRQSNSDLLQMIHKKIIEDYEVLQKQISDSAKRIELLKEDLQGLKNEQQKLQKYQTTIRNESSLDMIYWIKKQYFQFTNLSLRIKQNEKNYRVHVQKVRYYKSKLNGFFKQQKEKYDKVIFTRYLSFLDAYSITIQDALRMLTGVFGEIGYRYRMEQGPPKVREMGRSRNMNEVLSAETTYQEQYLERVRYYQEKIGGMLRDLQSMDAFLGRFRKIFGELLSNLKMEDNYSVKVDRGGRRELKLNAKYFQPLFEQLSVQSQRIYDVLSNLQQVNRQLRQDNEQQLIQMRQRIESGCLHSQQLLSSLHLQDGPLREKHRRVKISLSQSYKQIEELVGRVREFEQIYQKHQNRLKKIVVVSFIQFLSYQRKMICFDNYGEYLKQMADSGEANNEEFNPLETTNEGKYDLTTDDLTLQKFNHLQTGYLFSEEYKLLLNRFLFVAYTEWSKSQLFKHKVSKEIYIALNEDINQSFAEIVIEDFELSGLPPEAIWVKQLCCEQNEFMIDANLSFRGKIWMKISTIYLPVFNLPVELQISVEEFYAVVRLCFISNELGCSWLSFIGEPIAKVVIKPKLGEYKIDFESIANMFQNVILKKLKETVYPIKKKITIPLYKKDESYEFIQNRFKTMGMV